MRRKTDMFAIGAMAAGVGGAAARASIPATMSSLAQLGAILSLFHYSREMEAEADAHGRQADRRRRLPTRSRWRTSGSS